jgi:hypothetical protein
MKLLEFFVLSGAKRSRRTILQNRFDYGAKAAPPLTRACGTGAGSAN